MDVVILLMIIIEQIKTKIYSFLQRAFCDEEINKNEQLGCFSFLNDKNKLFNSFFFLIIPLKQKEN